MGWNGICPGSWGNESRPCARVSLEPEAVVASLKVGSGEVCVVVEWAGSLGPLGAGLVHQWVESFSLW